MECKNDQCKKEFHIERSLTGNAETWYLMECPFCGQLHGMEKPGMKIPADLNDKRIILL